MKTTFDDKEIPMILEGILEQKESPEDIDFEQY